MSETALVKPDGLTDKMWRFCQEYPKDFNATQAAIRAGYAKEGAGSMGWENLQKPQIKAGIELVCKSISISPAVIVAGLLEIATDRKNNEASRTRAFELLGRTSGMFVDRSQVIQDIKVHVEFDDDTAVSGDDDE